MSKTKTKAKTKSSRAPSEVGKKKAKLYLRGGLKSGASFTPEEIRIALEGKTKTAGPGSKSLAFEDLLKELQTCVDVERLCCIFQGIGQNAGLLAKYHKELEELLSLLFMFDWSCGKEVAQAFESLLCNLVSANAGFVEPCFQLLVSNLLPLEDADEPDEENESKSAVTEGSGSNDVVQDAADRERNGYIHSAIRAILRTVPLGCSTLLPVICEHFPLLWCPLHVLEGYVTETLAVADYVPVLRDRLLAIVFERIVLIDSEIRVEDLEACLRKAEEEEEGVFAMEDDDVSNGAMVNAKQDQRELKAMERVRELADKVDATMKILFKYCDNQCAKGPRHATSFVQLVLNLFDRFVLRSKTCAFAQFTMFFICKKRTEFCDMFVNRVLAYIIAVDTEKELRKQSIAYLASFVARARYMRKEAVGSTVRELVSWLLRYVERFEKGEQKSASASGLDGRVQGALNPNEHVEYFLVWQSVVYIMIYKGGDVSEDQLKRIPWVGLEQHLLNPFPFLPSYLVEEFVNFVVSRQEAFQFDYQTKEDLSSRLCKPPVGQLGKWYDQHAATLLTLDYPFDPCLLEVTAKTVEQDYQRWFTMESDEQEEYAMESEDEDVDELSDGEFSNKQLLVDPSRLPPAIRIPGLASGAMVLLGAGKQKDGGIAYWGFSRPSLTSSIESNHLSHRVGSHISKGTPRSADVVMDDASSSVTSSFNQIDTKLGGAAAHFTRRNSQDLEDSASQLSGSW